MPSIKMALVQRDRGFQKLFDTIRVMQNDETSVKVGVLAGTPSGDEGREGGITNTELAAIHEFGSSDGRIPERSFLRSTFEANRPIYVENLKTLLTKVIEGRMSLDQAFNVMGAKIAADIKKRVTAGDPIPPPNAPSTVARKRAKGAWNGAKGATGTIRTLVDTGRMIASITWAVVKGTVQ